MYLDVLNSLLISGEYPPLFSADELDSLLQVNCPKIQSLTFLPSTKSFKLSTLWPTETWFSTRWTKAIRTAEVVYYFVTIQQTFDANLPACCCFLFNIICLKLQTLTDKFISWNLFFPQALMPAIKKKFSNFLADPMKFFITRVKANLHIILCVPPSHRLLRIGSR